jgi:hypothetical protein
MAPTIHQLKLMGQVDGTPRKIRPEVLSKLRDELLRLSEASKPEHVKKFVRIMRDRYPELANL